MKIGILQNRDLWSGDARMLEQDAYVRIDAQRLDVVVKLALGRGFDLRMHKTSVVSSAPSAPI
jgi:hypothetical protein